jgi:hypothetical protein
VVCPRWFHDVHAPLVAAMSNARYVEFFWDDQVLNFRKLVDRGRAPRQVDPRRPLITGEPA